MRVLITGATTWTDIEAMRRELSQLPKDCVIVTGDTSGVDALSIALAQELGFSVEAMCKTEEDYVLYLEDSWKRLNHRMLNTGIDLVLAFHPDYEKPGMARGTRHAVELAEQSGVRAHIFRA